MGHVETNVVRTATQHVIIKIFWLQQTNVVHMYLLRSSGCSSSIEVLRPVRL
jgi:hypothetical protein